jgi:4,5-dihydroxyphthalate decarboxylase
MAKLNLSVAVGDYDRTRPLIDGNVTIDGVDPVFMNARSGRDFLSRLPRRRVRYLRTVAVELHGEDRAGRLSVYRRTGLRLPRLPPHRGLCAHRPGQKAGRPQGPQGRRAGISAHGQCMGARFARRRLRRQAVRHPLDPRRHRDAGRPEKITITLPPGVRLDNAPEGATISALLEAGEIDGFIAPRPPALVERGHPNIGWLFPDPVPWPRIISNARDFSRSCTSSASAVRSPSGIRGSRRGAQGLRTVETGSREAVRHVSDQGDAAVCRGGAYRTRAR